MTIDQNELQKIGIAVSEKIQYERIYEKIQWSLSILFLVILPIGLVFLLIQGIFPINIDTNIVLSVLFFLFCFTFLILVILKIYVVNGINSILDSNKRILHIDMHTTSLEDTIGGVTLIYKNIEIILQWKKIIQWAIFYRESGGREIGEQITSFLEGEILYTTRLISNFRADLNIYLEKEQSTLESAKSEVEKNITGTTELNQVSELQRARLDKQIEQFEELQRVLVKV